MSCALLPHKDQSGASAHDETPLHAVPRYAYFKRLDYFSTECIYSPEGAALLTLYSLPCIGSG